MIWWVVGIGAVGSVVLTVTMWLYQRRRIMQLINAAAEFARTETDLEHRRTCYAERTARHEADSVADIRQREHTLVEETRHDSDVGFVERINRR